MPSSGLGPLRSYGCPQQRADKRCKLPDENAFMCVDMYVCVSFSYFLHSTICPWWSGLHNYFSLFSHILTFSHHLSPFPNHSFPHHNSSSHPFLLLRRLRFVFSTLVSSVHPSLLSVSAYLSSSPVLCPGLASVLRRHNDCLWNRGGVNGHLDNDGGCVGDVARARGGGAQAVSVGSPHLLSCPSIREGAETSEQWKWRLFFSVLLLFFFSSFFERPEAATMCCGLRWGLCGPQTIHLYALLLVGDMKAPSLATPNDSYISHRA